MRTMCKLLFAGCVFLVSTGAALAAGSEIGTWNLNVAKSTFSPGPAPKSQTRTYAETAGGTALTVKTTAADGKESTVTLTFKEDGKPYPATGAGDFDTVAVTRVDALTVHSTQSKAGTTVGSGVRSVSKDGKTLKYSQKGTHADGVKYNDVSVYDRQ